MHARVVLGVGKGVLFREVYSFPECPHKREGSTVYKYVASRTVYITMYIYVYMYVECTL